jgi:DNA-binding response OmpR family regulator
MARRGESDCVRILIVEDDPSLGRVLRLALGAYGHQATLAVTGSEALQFLERERVELIVLDLDLPDMEGWDVLRALPSLQRSQTRVLISSVTAVQPRRLAEEALCGAIQKPFDMRTLLRAIEHVQTDSAAARAFVLSGVEADHGRNAHSAAR